MTFGDVAERSRLDDLGHPAIIIPGVNLRPKLSGDAGLFGLFSDDPGLFDRVSQRFFAVDMESFADSPDRCRGMAMIGRADDDCVNFVCFSFDHLSVIRVRSSVLEASFLRSHVVRIDVAEGNDVLSSNAVDVGKGPVGRSDTGDYELFVG